MQRTLDLVAMLKLERGMVRDPPAVSMKGSRIAEIPLHFRVMKLQRIELLKQRTFGRVILQFRSSTGVCYKILNALHGM